MMDRQMAMAQASKGGAQNIQYGHQKLQQFIKPLAVKVNSHRDEESLISHTEQQDEEFDESEIFNDVLDGGGVEPSINESIRDSIKYSFVSSEEGDPEGQRNIGGGSGTTMGNTESVKDSYVMNRMNWITYLKVLFDELESFSQANPNAKQKHVEQGNFIKALRKIKNMLPLQPKLDYMKKCGEVAFSYKEVEAGFQGVGVQRYLSWDNVIDMFLAKQAPMPIIYQVQPYSQNGFNHLMTEESMVSAEVNLKEEEDVVPTRVNQGQNQQQTLGKPQVRKAHKKDGELFISFADSVIKMNTGFTGNANVTASQEMKQQMMHAKAPLLRDRPDEACTIESDTSSDTVGEVDDSDDESKVKTVSKKGRQRSEFEDSVRSSRTANFKSIGGGAAGTNNQSNVFTTINTQDSYYGGHQQLSMNPNVNPAIPKKPVQEMYYKGAVVEEEKKDSSRCSSSRAYGDTEVQNSAQRAVERDDILLKNMQTQAKNQSSTKSIGKTVASAHHSTQASNQNALKHSQTTHDYDTQSIKNTLIKGSLTSQSQQSVHSYNSACTTLAGNFLDLDMQAKGLRNFEIDMKQQSLNLSDKKQVVLRSINLSQNCLQRFPPALEKSLQFLNVSHNKLKSLTGIESCINLKFLNASYNLIASAQGIVILQSLRELVLSNNQLSLIKEIGQLKNLVLLDLAHNKIITIDKLQPLASLRKLHTLVLVGNLLTTKTLNYEQSVKKLVPSVQVLDPDQVKDFSQFQEFEGICFPMVGSISEEYDGQSMLQMNDKLQLDFSDKDLPLIIAHSSSTPVHSQPTKDRSRTPNKDPVRFKVEKGVPSFVQPPSVPLKMKSPARPKKEATLKTQETKVALVTLSKSQTRKYDPVPTPMGDISDKRSSLLAAKGSTKSKTRDRSTSNNTKSVASKVSAPSTTTVQPNASHIDKKMSANVNLAKAICAQHMIGTNQGGRITPNQRQSHTSSVTLPIRDTATIHGGKKGFNRTTNISALDLTELNQDQNMTTSANINRQSQLSMQSSQNQSVLSLRNPGATKQVSGSKYVKHSYIDVSSQVYNSTSVNSKSKQSTTQINKRASTSQKKEEDSPERASASIQPFSYYQPPQTARNADQKTLEFVPKLTPIQQFRQQILTQENSQRGTATQLQRFITASKSASRQTSQTPTLDMNQPSKIMNNLPPRAYQSRLENPGDKKSKADSIISSSGGHHINFFHNVSQQSIMNQSQLQNANNGSDNSRHGNIMQTGGTVNDDEDDESQQREPLDQIHSLDQVKLSKATLGTGGGSSGGSMSPVCDEVIASQRKQQSKR